MAEAAGLALGIVALAGVFKDCVDLFAYISASRNLGQDYELLNIKLDIEKTLLLQWAFRVGLHSESQYDTRLDQPNVERAISGVLSGIVLLLSDSQKLQSRYGLQETETVLEVDGRKGPTRHGATLADRANSLGGPRMTRFIADFNQLSIRANSP